MCHRPGVEHARARRSRDVPGGRAHPGGANLAAIIPFGNGVTIQLVSERVGSVQANRQLGVLLPQMWIR